MNFDYQKLQEAADSRAADLKRFEETWKQFQARIQVLEEIQSELEDLHVCYQELDNETKRAVPSDIGAVLMHRTDKVLSNLIGNNDQVGLKHLYPNE